MSEYNKCPYCGYKPEVTPLYYVEGDLLNCGKCNGRIDVVEEDGKLLFVKSTDTTFGVD